MKKTPNKNDIYSCSGEQFVTDKDALIALFWRRFPAGSSRFLNMEKWLKRNAGSVYLCHYCGFYHLKTD